MRPALTFVALHPERARRALPALGCAPGAGLRPGCALAPPSEVTLAARPPGAAAAPPAVRAALRPAEPPGTSPEMSAAGRDSRSYRPGAPRPGLPGRRALPPSRPEGGGAKEKGWTSGLPQVSTEICRVKSRDCEPNAGRRRLRAGGAVETGLQRLLLTPHGSAPCPGPARPRLSADSLTPRQLSVHRLAPVNRLPFRAQEHICLQPAPWWQFGRP